MSSKFLDYTGLSYLVQKLAPKLIPNQSGQSGKVLTTDGTNASWASADAVAAGTRQTNCVLEIPRNIIYTFSNGTLTIKAGSVVYFPNGMDNGQMLFETREIENDIVVSNSVPFYSGEVPKYYLVVLTDDETWGLQSELVIPACSTCSGTEPSGLLPYISNFLWYDTTNNLIKLSPEERDEWSFSGVSFPLLLCSTDQQGDINGVAQVFNGFGFVGSQAFVLPQVKFLMSNGRNADGTLNNVTYTTTNVMLTNYNANENTRYAFYITSSGALGVQEQSLVGYDFASNFNSNNGTNFLGAFFASAFTGASGSEELYYDDYIDEFLPNQAFRQVDWNSNVLPKYIPMSGCVSGLTAYEQSAIKSVASNQSFYVNHDSPSSLVFTITSSASLTLYAETSNNPSFFAIKTIYVKGASGVSTSLSVSGLTDWIGDVPSWSGLTGAHLMFNVIFMNGEAYGQVLVDGTSA